MSSFDLILRHSIACKFFHELLCLRFSEVLHTTSVASQRGKCAEDCICVQSNIFTNDILHWKAPNTSVSSGMHTWRSSVPFKKCGYAKVQPSPAAWASEFLSPTQLSTESRSDAKSQGAQPCTECSTSRAHWSSTQGRQRLCAVPGGTALSV